MSSGVVSFNRIRLIFQLRFSGEMWSIVSIHPDTVEYYLSMNTPLSYHPGKLRNCHALGHAAETRGHLVTQTPGHADRLTAIVGNIIRRTEEAIAGTDAVAVLVLADKEQDRPGSLDVALTGG